MMNFILGVSLSINLFLLILLIGACAVARDYKKQLKDNPYSELEDLMHDSDWDRIRDTNPPPRTGVELPNTLVAAAGKRDINSIRR